jgi:hypothetical protein
MMGIQPFLVVGAVFGLCAVGCLGSIGSEPGDGPGSEPPATGGGPGLEGPATGGGSPSEGGGGGESAPWDAGLPAPPDAGTPPRDAGAPPPDAGLTPGLTADGGRDYSADSTKFFGASRCAESGLLLCDDFESGTLDSATWAVSGTAPVIDGLQHARGSKALHITVHGNGQSLIREHKTFPASKNTFYGRMFVYFRSLPSVQMGYAHWTIAAANNGDGSSQETRVSGQNLNAHGPYQNLFGVGTYGGPTGDWTNADDDPAGHPTPVPLDRWICLEWMDKGDTNETRFWWDSVEHHSLYTSQTLHGYGNGGTASAPYILPQYTQAWVGWAEYQSSTETFEMWIDEVAIDRERIGCAL